MFLDFANWLETTSVSLVIQTVTWVIPLVQSIHIVTLAVVYISVAMITARIFGLVREQDSLAEVVQRFLPSVWIGLVVMAVTGGLLVIGEPVRQFTALSFWLKMGLLAALLVSGAIFGRVLASAGSHAAPTGGIKSIAAVTILLWTCLIYLGRAIAYDVEVWGSLSLTQGV